MFKSNRNLNSYRQYFDSCRKKKFSLELNFFLRRFKLRGYHFSKNKNRYKIFRQGSCKEIYGMLETALKRVLMLALAYFFCSVWYTLLSFTNKQFLIVNEFMTNYYHSLTFNNFIWRKNARFINFMSFFRFNDRLF